MSVIIHGVEYVPRSEAGITPQIGIAITTHNRNDMLQRALAEHKKFLPENAYLVVVDDGSAQPATVPDGVKLIRSDKAEGISYAKNRCLAELIDAGCQELFLFDDDCWPKVAGWEKPYINSPEPHLAHSWNLLQVWRDSEHTASHACGGTVLYYNRSTILEVGGMRHCFGRYGCEHVNLSDRIHNRGLTTWRYPDVSGSEHLFYECDRYEKGTHKTAADAKALEHNRTKGVELWRSMRGDKEYFEFRKQHDYVVTCLLTQVRDPQRNNNMSASIDMVTALAKSVRVGQLVVIHDSMENPQLKTGAGEDVIFIKVENVINPYFGRWQHIYQWLRANPQARNVWAVDATDVTQLRNPFDTTDGKLYIGTEQATLSSKWLTNNTADASTVAFLQANRENTMLNPGTVGGDRQTVQEFCHAMVKAYYDDHIDDAQGWERKRIGPFDMATVQKVCYTQFADRLVYGPQVNTFFKGERPDEFARWKHK